MELSLSDVKVGEPSIPSEWDNGQRRYIPVDYKERFLTGLKRSISSDTELVYVCDSLNSNAKHYHLNYMSYLQKCWADHLGVVVSPDIIWYTLLSELTLIIKEDPENYRDLFSTSDKKQEILICSGDPVMMPIDTLTKVLEDRVPIETESFFPEFSTRTPKSFFAFQASFCDMCSPYYNYSMYLCGIPKIDVRGSLDDWKNLLDKWKKLSSMTLDKANAWAISVYELLNSLIQNYNKESFWNDIFSLKRCGSGGQVEVLGWFSKLFRFQPKVKYVENYSNHISIIKYKQLNFDINYEMGVGVFESAKEDDFMVPDFGYVIHSKAWFRRAHGWTN